MESKSKHSTFVAYFLLYNIFKQLCVFKMGGPQNGTALGNADLSMTPAAQDNTNETNIQKSEKVSDSYILNIINPVEV